MTQQEYDQKINKLQNKIQKLDSKRNLAKKGHDTKLVRSLTKMINVCKTQIQMLQQYATIRNQ